VHPEFNKEQTSYADPHGKATGRLHATCSRRVVRRVAMLNLGYFGIAPWIKRATLTVYWPCRCRCQALGFRQGTVLNVGILGLIPTVTDCCAGPRQPGPRLPSTETVRVATASLSYPFQNRRIHLMDFSTFRP